MRTDTSLHLWCMKFGNPLINIPEVTQTFSLGQDRIERVHITVPHLLLRESEYRMCTQGMKRHHLGEVHHPHITIKITPNPQDIQTVLLKCPIVKYGAFWEEFT